jgi:hypothetical protein
MTIPPEATLAGFGDIVTDRREYEPLDTVTVKIRGRAPGRDSSCSLSVLDASGRRYFETDLPLADNRGEASFHAAGSLGVHRVFLRFPGARRHSRFASFLLDCRTAVRTGDPVFDGIVPRTREALRLNRRE